MFDPIKMALVQLGKSLVTNKDGRDLLDPNIIERIRFELCNITVRIVIGLASVAITIT